MIRQRQGELRAIRGARTSPCGGETEPRARGIQRRHQNRNQKRHGRNRPFASFTVSSWRTRGAWPEITWPSVCPMPHRVTAPRAFWRVWGAGLRVSGRHQLADLLNSLLERTFLAWLRTSLAFASIGVAVTQLFRLQTSGSASATEFDHTKLQKMGRPLGATFLGISIVTLLLGCRRYFHAQEWILQGKFPASRGTIIIMSLVALALMILSLVVVIVIR